MAITLNDTKQAYVVDVLTHCITILRMRMTDLNVCAANRDVAMEYHAMARKARSIVNGEEASNDK